MKSSIFVAVVVTMLLGGCERPGLEERFEFAFSQSLPSSFKNIHFQDKSGFGSSLWSLSASVDPKDIRSILQNLNLRSDFSDINTDEYPDPLRVADFQGNLHFDDIPLGNAPLVKEYYKTFSIEDEEFEILLYTTRDDKFIVIRVSSN